MLDFHAESPENCYNNGLRRLERILRRLPSLFLFALLALLVASPRCASGARLQRSATARVHSARVLSWSGPTFGTILQAPVDNVAAPHHRVRRRALRSDSLRMEPVVLEITDRRDLVSGVPLSADLDSPGRSPPSV